MKHEQHPEDAEDKETEDRDDGEDDVEVGIAAATGHDTERTQADQEKDVDEAQVEEGRVVAGLEVAYILLGDEPALSTFVHHRAQDGRGAVGAAQYLAAVVVRVGARDVVVADEMLEERADVVIGQAADADLSERGEEESGGCERAGWSGRRR